MSSSTSTDMPEREEIAIVGMAGRFPGARNVGEYWDNLRRGVESIRPLTREELSKAAVDKQTLNHPDFVNAAAVMDDADGFDASFFGMSKREADFTDPQHRVLLECAWEALEHAGYNPEGYRGRIGLFGGVAPNTYFQKCLAKDPDLVEKFGAYALMIASEREYSITRVAFKLNLTGPAVSVNTACSTSGVAIHLACQSLLSGESDMALAGGARIRAPLYGGYVYKEDGILSPDGHCRAFDAEARGTVVASGVGFVVLKNLSDARRDGDTVYALVKGTAINNDGANKIGYTAPSAHGQAAVIKDALEMAEVSADSINYVEAHGTGTSLGDPIEIAGLTEAYRKDTDRCGFCALGSVKTNIGHLDAGAGVAGVIKTALALRSGQIPPSLHFQKPNPQIDFASSPFYVNDKLATWPNDQRPRRAAVSSFGLGGTNAHIILEEPPPEEPSTANAEYQLILLSARTESALEEATRNLAKDLADGPVRSLSDIAYTLQVGRRHFEHRKIAIGREVGEVVTALGASEAKQKPTLKARAGRTSIAFMFSGQGSQYVGMTRGLYEHFSQYRDVVDHCAAMLEPYAGVDVRDLIFPLDRDAENATLKMRQTEYTQPTLFVIEYALANLIMSWGIRPDALVGHSIGEVVAACLAGVMDLEDALRLVAARGRLMQSMPKGDMLAVPLTEAEARARLGEGMDLAAINSSSAVVVSGRSDAIDALQKSLAAEGLETQRLETSHAFHSAMMEPIVEAYTDEVRSVALSPPKLPLVSNLTGRWMTAEQATDPAYWSAHLRQTVRFSDCLEQLLTDPHRVFLEVGPGRTLATLARRHRTKTSQQTVVSLTRHPNQSRADVDMVLEALGRLWMSGVKPDWRSFSGGKGRRVPLPTYPFERRRHWIEPSHSQQFEVQHTANTDVGSMHPVEEREEVVENQEMMPVALAKPASRRDWIIAEIVAILSDLNGVNASEIETDVTFLDLGFDSLFLTQANSQFRKKFGVRITFRHLFDKTPSIDALAAFLDEKLPSDAYQPAELATADSSQIVPMQKSNGTTTVLEDQLSRWRQAAAGLNGSNPVERVIGDQLKLMETQLKLLRESLSGQDAKPSGNEAKTVVEEHRLPSNQSVPNMAKATWASRSPVPTSRPSLTDRQQGALDELIARYCTSTRKSKALAQRWRPRVADNRTIVGFDRIWKELVYQIVSVRSCGSRIWDVDGNEYVDTAMCLGANLLGHSPEFVVQAVQDQLARGYEVATQNRLLGEVSEMVCSMTDNERLTYCYSGSEAVETAIRIARTATGRDMVAYFTNDIHGRSDVVLGRAVAMGDRQRTVPQVVGIPQQVVDQALVLEYGTQEAFDAIREKASELALVLVEPVRTRNPDRQPIDFLRDLRQLADETGFLLVFDEVVTGFRAHQGGFQALFDIRADLTTYGKVLGGGMPIGVVAGKSEFIDLIDGGQWTFGDSSYPEADITASGGTMIKHPVTLAASHALLQHLKSVGPSLQEDLTKNTSRVVSELNDHYLRLGLPIHIEQFSSFLRPTLAGNRKFESLFQYFLRDGGVHTNPPSASFLSTAHTEEDLDTIIRAYKQAAENMAIAGFLDDDASAARHAPDGAKSAVQGDSDQPVPLLPNVARFLGERGTPGPHHWNLAVLLEAKEPLQHGLIRRTLEQLLARHDAFRLRFFESDGNWHSAIAPVGKNGVFSVHDLSDVPVEDQAMAIGEIAGTLQTSFDLSKGLLLRVAQLDLGSSGHRLLVIIHHFAMDGLSWRPFWEDFQTAYEQLSCGQDVVFAMPSSSFREWAVSIDQFAKSERIRSDLAQWQRLPWKKVKRLPLDFPSHEASNTNRSANTVTLEFTVDETNRLLGTTSVPKKVDFLFAALAESLAEWTGSNTVLFEVMGHGREEELFDDMDLFGTIGFFISYTPLVLEIQNSSANDIQSRLLANQIQPVLRNGLTFDLLRFLGRDDKVKQALQSLPRAEVLFNYQGRRTRLDVEPPGSALRLANEPSGNTHCPDGIRYYPLAISSEVWNDRLRLNFVYSESLHKQETIEGLAKRYREIVLELVEIAHSIDRCCAKGITLIEGI